MRRPGRSSSIAWTVRAAVAGLCCTVGATALAKDETHPAATGVLLILADDLGFSDVGCYGGEIPTPNLDRLAANGMRFSQFYNFARCSPSRAALLTGLYPHEVGMARLAEDQISVAPEDALPAYRRYLDPEIPTLAEMLRPAGITTVLSGKWHLGAHGEQKRPLARGFDWFYGFLYGSGSYHRPMPPRPLVWQHEELSPPEPGSDFYTTDAFADELITYLRARRADEQWLAYLAFNAPHWPLHAREEDVAKFVGRYRAGWDVMRAQRFARQRELGIIGPEAELSPRDELVRAWDSLSSEEQEQLDFRMAVYAAQVYRMDLAIGRVVDALEEMGRLDNTLILFVSDNGASAEPNTDLGGGIFEAVNQPEAFGSGSWRAPAKGSSYGAGWANLSNTPFRRYKARLHEGGVRSPAILHWPEGLRLTRGGITHEPVSLLDVVPTVVDAMSPAYPADHDAASGDAFRGTSLLPLLRGEAWTRSFVLHLEQYGHRAVRIGHWKALLTREADAEWELYDLSEDPTELRDQAGNHPERLADMITAWERWADEVGVDLSDSDS